MNDKDKEAFDKWYASQDKAGVFGNDDTLYVDLAWLAACEYKQKEITLLENEISYLEETISDFMDDPDIAIKRLQEENKKLRECVEYYSDLDDECIGYDIRGVTTAREALKKLESA